MSAQGKQGVCCMTDFVGGAGNDIFYGDWEGDVLVGNGGSDSLYGGGGTDFLYAAGRMPNFYGSIYYLANPLLDTGAEADLLDGGEGEDFIFAGYNDTVVGDGDDRLFISLMGATSGATLDFDDATNANGAGTISNIWFVNWIQGSNFSDNINLRNLGGDTVIYAMSGDDRVVGAFDTQYISGGDGDDYLVGGQLTILVGGNGNDTLIMGEGIATASGDAGNDIIYASATAHGGSGDDYIVAQFTYYGPGRMYGDEGNDEIHVTAGATYVFGGVGADRLFGGEEGDWLASGEFVANNFAGYPDMGAEKDVLAGGAGDDVLSVGAGDDADGGEGSDTLYLSLGAASAGVIFDVNELRGGAPLVLAGGTLQNIENLAYLRGTDFADIVTLATQAGSVDVDSAGGDDVVIAGASPVYLTAGAGNDRFVSGAGADRFDGGEGHDTIDYSTAASAVQVQLARGSATSGAATGGDTLISVENIIGSAHGDVLDGDDADNQIWGGDGDDQIRGFGGNDRLDGGAGADTLIGGAGDDTYYVDNIGDVIVELDGEGYDSVFASASVDLSGNFVEYLYLTGSANANGIGNGLNNIILANAGNNVLIGGEGLDTLNYQTATGVVTISLAVTGPQVTGGSGTDTISGFENIHGSLYSDHLTGNDGNNVFDGYWGGDTMVGLGGDDIYIVDHVLDNVVELAGGGNDAIYSFVSYSLAGRDVETLFLESGMGPLNATGNANANTLVGNEFANILDGKGGADLLIGGAGDDVYIVDGAGTRVIETAGEGYDIVRTSVGLDLAGQSVEEIRATGTAAIAIRGGDMGSRIVGNGAANILTGGIGDDKLFGGDGNDRLEGGAGRDYLDGGAGIDTASYAHAAAGVVVSLAVSGTQNTRGAGVDQLLGIENVEGSAFADRLTGDAGANVINGLDGADVMIGGAGNDVYYVDNIGDKVVEKAGGGFDTVVSSIDHVLAANVEALTLSGSDDIEATGNSLDNVLTGNAGDNRLRGGTGADMMIGGAGDDIYYVDNAGDRVVEQAGEGHDLVVSSVSFNLHGTGAEDIKLLGSAALNAEGDAGANRVTGNAGHNVLRGDAGNDVLTGGAGYDNFVFDTALGKNNVDRITDFSVADDTILLNAAIFGAAGPAGYLAQGAFQTGSVASEADDRILYDAASGNIFYDADGSGAGAAVLFAQVTPGLGLTHMDFIVLG